MKSFKIFSSVNDHGLGKSNCYIPKSQAGFSLVELMVAIALGLLVVSALLALYININRANNEMAKTNSQIENGRLALQVLQTDVAHAGFWAGFIPQFEDLTLASAPTDIPQSIPNPCMDYGTLTAQDKTNLIGINVQVYRETPPQGAGCLTLFTANRQPSTDILVVRHAETCVTGSVGCDTEDVGDLYFQASQCELENATPYVLGIDSFNLHKRECGGTAAAVTGDIADKRRFVSNIYYIRDYASVEGDGIPTLMMSSFDSLAHQAAVPLIEGIEGFSVEIGVDSLSSNSTNVITNADASNLYSAVVKWADSENLTSPVNRGDGAPDGAFISCNDEVPCSVEQLANLVAVRIYVLARANTETPSYTDTKTYSLGNTVLGPYGDGFKRHVFSSTVRLNNISGRRETPL
jgi:type IV pilus assembly protein PilW